MSTQTIAAIDTSKLPAAQRVVLGKLLEGAAKEVVRGLKGDKAKLKQGAHPGVITLRVDGEVVVDKAGKTTSTDLSLEELVVVAVGPAKLAAWVQQHAKKVKAMRKAKAKSAEIDDAVKDLKQRVKDEADRLGMTSFKPKAGATRCEPRITVSEIKVA